MPAPLFNDWAEALGYLQSTKSTAGSSVYEHLTEVLLKVLEERPDNAVDLLETSLLTKRTTFDAKETSPLVPLSSAADAAKVVAVSNLFGYADLPVDPETGEPVEAESPNEYECEDAMMAATLFDSVGVGLGKQEMVNVMLAVKKLGEDPKKGVQTVRFFGKFFGLYADYYVFETTLKEAPEEPPAAGEGEIPIEANTGANGYVYFVCNYLGGPMTRLPYVTPVQIKAARTIKKFLTGRLTSHVSTYPVFPGNEANFLRAQIARIAATTVCCPNGLFTVDEEGSLEKNEEFEPLLGREMSNPANWSHRYAHIKKQGRCEVHKREPPEDEDEDSFEYTEEELEEGPELLATLETDTPVSEDVAWTPLYSSSNENVKNQVAGVRSNLWPGAFVACQNGQFASLYVGWGVKNAPFVPMPPPPVAAEFDQTVLESQELPPKPAPPPAEGEEAAEE